ncbi:MAG: methyltransferase domain-containing protein, partial [Snowella sp.]|nr:methyltransferase domain-containing protein [Snowella sp.]
MLKFILQTNKKVANDSPDHLMPHGTKYDNSSNLIFSQKLNLLFSHKGQVTLLDLGCSGGGFVKSCLDLGYVAIGLEGSDYSQKERRAEWNTIPDNLFTCDISSPFNLKQVNDNEEKLFDAQFDVVTAWEFIEHIKKEDLPTVCENVKRHLAPNGVWIMSVSPNEEIINGQRLHQTVENKNWWEDFFNKAGFNNNPNIVDYFGNDWVRGPFQSAPGSFHFVLTRCQDLAPSMPKLSQNNLNGDILYKAGVDFFDQGIKSGDILKICYGLFCLIRMSDNTRGIESCLQLATEIYTDCQENFSPNVEKSISRPLSFLLSSKSNFVTSNLLSKTLTAQPSRPPSAVAKQAPIILIDGVFFQLYKTGIARVWKSLLEQWAKTEFGAHLLVLDRNNTAPKIDGLRYRTIGAYDYTNTDQDRQLLQQICDEEQAELFISSYYTTPLTTPSVFMAYDMIPEVLGGDLNQPMWREKHRGINHASAFIAISHNTAKDLRQHFPQIPPAAITVAHCGVDPRFSPASPQEIANFKFKYGLQKPYFLVMLGGGHKNIILFLRGFAQLATRTGLDIVATGAVPQLPPEWRELTAGCGFQGLQLTDEELKVAYSGAIALVYPS